MVVKPANLIEIKTVTYNQPANLALIPIGDVSYRQCGNIQKRGPIEAICLHENEK